VSRPGGVGTVVSSGGVTVLYGSTSGLTATNSQIWVQSSPGVPGIDELADRFGSGSGMLAPSRSCLQTAAASPPSAARPGARTPPGSRGWPSSRTSSVSSAQPDCAAPRRIISNADIAVVEQATPAHLHRGTSDVCRNLICSLHKIP
jgi:hypothetical protein